jgi:hypothetical protein
VILSPAETRIKHKIEEAGRPLKEWNVNIYRGILTGYNDAFIIDGNIKDQLLRKCPEAAEIIRPILKGADIKRYKYSFHDLWLINTHNGIRINGIPRIDVEKDYPAVFEHLNRFRKELIKRMDKGDHWTNLRNCAYQLDFENEKVVWQELSRSGNAFCYVQEPMYFTNTAFMLTGLSSVELKYLTAVLNHKISLFYLEQVYAKLDETGWRWFKMAVEQIPIPQISQKGMSYFATLVDQIQYNLSVGVDCTELFKSLEDGIYSIYNFEKIDIEVLSLRMDSYFRSL